MRKVIGCVPYVNAKPIVDRFHFGPPTDIEVIYDVPSRLPALLDSGSAEAVLASSFDALATPDRTFAEGVSISTFGPVQSVRLFSKVHPVHIRTLALDQSSLTSNHLAQIVLRERYDASAECVQMEPELNSMLNSCDACVLIGDKGMSADATGLKVLDLGEEWFALTGLPFVWALWIGNKHLSGELVYELNESKRWGIEHLDSIIPRAAETSGIPTERVDHYLRKIMDFDLSSRHIEGLRRFHSLLLTHGFLSNEQFPSQVGSLAAAAPSS